MKYIEKIKDMLCDELREYSERYDRGYDRRYSMDKAKDHMMSKLGEMMDGADPNEREILEQAMRKPENV